MRRIRPDDAETAWMAEASCATGEHDPALWFPGQGEDSSEAKQICATCPVKNDCLEHAFANREIHGTWGGLTQSERKRLRAQRVRDRRAS